MSIYPGSILYLYHYDVILITLDTQTLIVGIDCMDISHPLTFVPRNFNFSFPRFHANTYSPVAILISIPEIPKNFNIPKDTILQ